MSRKNSTFSTKFSVISIGPEANPYLVRLEGMINSSIANKKENKPNIYLILKSRKSNYIFKTHPHQYFETEDDFIREIYFYLFSFYKVFGSY